MKFRRIAGFLAILARMLTVGTLPVFDYCAAQEKSGDASHLEKLIKGLGDQHTSVAHASAQSLAEIGGQAKPAVPALLEAVKTRPDIRSTSVYAIGRIAEALGKKFGTANAESALPPLTRALDDNDEKIREVTAYAIGRLDAALEGTGEEQATQDAALGLIRTLSDRQPRVERAAVEALGRFGQSGVFSDKPGVEVRAEDAVRALIAELHANRGKTGADYELVQVDSMAALGRFEKTAEPAVPDLAAALQNGNPTIQAAAAYALASIGSNAVAGPLRNALVDGTVEVKRVAAFALGRVHGPAADTVPALTAALTDNNPAVREAVTEALKTYGSDPGAFPALISAVNDDEPEVRIAAAKTLGTLAENSLGSDPEQLIRQLDKALKAVVNELRRLEPTDPSRPALLEAQAKIQSALDQIDPWWKRHLRMFVTLLAAVIVGLCFLVSGRLRQGARTFFQGWRKNAPAEGVMGRLQRWYARIYQDSEEWRPGYFGKIPYLLVMRCGIVVAIYWRNQLHAPHLFPTRIDIALLILMVFAFVLHLRKKSYSIKKIYSVWIYTALVGIDIIVVSIAYWFTGNKESDFFLFYCLPIFTAAEFLENSRLVVLAFLAASVAFGYVVFEMPLMVGYRGGPAYAIFKRIFLPRELFFFFLTLIWALRLKRERNSRARAITRQEQMNALLVLKEDIDGIFSLEEVLRVIVEHARKDLQARSVVAVLFVNGEDGQAKKITEWAGKEEEELLVACQQSLEGRSPGDAVPIVISRARSAPKGGVAESLSRRGWVGAIAVSGLDPGQMRDANEYLRSLAELVAIARDRIRFFQVVREVGAAAAKSAELNKQLEAMLDQLIDRGFQYAIISLVDVYKDRVGTVRGRNVPPGWIKSSSYSLLDSPDNEDILVWIVKNKRTQTFDTYDPRFKFEIWHRYGHERLARVFVPILDPEREEGLAVGVIEAGCPKDQRHVVEQNLEMVKALGRATGGAIARSLPHVLLELIATRAVELIGADSASLHVYRGAEEFLVAGTSRANKEFLRKFPPRMNGSGSKAMATGRPVIENELPATKKELRAEGVHAMAAFPLRLAEDVRGVLYIHYWREHKFTDAEADLANLFIPQMEVAIQNALLLQDFSRIDEKEWMITGLENVIKSLGSTLSLDRLLKRLAEDARYILDPKNVTLYQYDQDNKTFSPAVTAGQFEQEHVMKTAVQADDIVTKVVESGESKFIPRVWGPEGEFLRQPRTDGVQRPRFVEREGIRSCAILVLRVPNDVNVASAGSSSNQGEIVGCLFANYENEYFDGPKRTGFKSLASSLASSAAVAIKAARLHQQDMESTHADIERREKEIEALRAIDHAIVDRNEGMMTREICQIVLDEALKVLGDLTLGDVTIWNERKKRLEVMASYGFPDGWTNASFPKGEGLVGWVAQEQKYVLVDNVELDPRYRKINAKTRSELAVPILNAAGRESVLIGVINVEHLAVNAFSERDRAFLETLAVQLTIAEHTVDLSRKLNRQLQRLVSLSEVMGRIQGPNLRKEAILRMILTGVTARDGLGFRRAILFELNDDTSELRATIGIGKLTKHSSVAVWERLEEKGPDFKALLELAARPDGHHVENSEIEWRRFVQSLTVPVQSLPPYLIELLQGNDLRVLSGTAKELTQAKLGALYDGAADCPVAWVPLKGREKAVGALLVDNRFSDDEKNLDSTLNSILTAFAELAAMSIDAERLRERLVEQQQLTNLREASARAAHALQERILNVEYRLRDARRDLEERDLKKASEKLDQLEKTIQDVNNRLHQIKTFGATRSQLVMSRVEMVGVMRHIVDTRRANLRCKIEIHTEEAEMYARADQAVLPEMFADLLVNGDRATKNQAEPRIDIYMRTDREHQRLVIEIEDNGPGIQSNIADKIFDPYITTSGGTGLGLPEIKRLVEDHGGGITAGVARNGRGARFTIWLPLQEEALAA